MLPTIRKNSDGYTIENAPALFVAVLEVLIKKSLDYNGDRARQPDFKVDDKRETYFPFGDKSYVHMIWTKVLRIKNILESGENPNFEGVSDSLIDLVAYSMFYWTYLEEKKAPAAPVDLTTREVQEAVDFLKRIANKPSDPEFSYFIAAKSAEERESGGDKPVVEEWDTKPGATDSKANGRVVPRFEDWKENQAGGAV